MSQITEALAALRTKFDLFVVELDALIDAAQAAARPTPEPPDPVPTQVVRRNVGGQAVTVDGVPWEADRGYQGGQTSDQGAAQHGEDSIYATERWGDFAYPFTGLPPGPATLRLHFAENHGPTDQIGERVFDVAVGGLTVLSGYDIVREAGGQYRPVVATVSTTVPATGRVDVALTGRVNAAALHGLEVVCYGAVVPTPIPEPPTAPPQPGDWPRIVGPTPGISWPGSGGNPNNNRQDTAAAFGVWRGAPVTSALTFPPRDAGWEPLISATALPQGVWTDRKIRLWVQMSPFPKGAYTYAAAARGEYNGYYRRLGQNWRARGFRVTLSFAWEANHNGAGMHFWGGPGGGPQRFQTFQQYIDTWREFARSVREGWPDADPDELRLAWTMNGHDSVGFASNNPFDIYPGDDVVDVIAVDYYDQYPPSFGGTNTSGRRKDFWVEADDVNGVRWYAKQAWRRGKLFAAPEWAVVTGTDNHGGDNSSFVRNMHIVFEEADAAGVMDTEHYYEDEAQRMGIKNGQHPLAAAEYRRLWVPT